MLCCRMIEVKHEMSYAKGKPMDNMSLFEFHPDNVPEMICQRGEVTQMIKDDLISRQAAINQITKRFDDIQMLDWEKYPNAPFIQSGLLWSINTIRDLPSAQQDADVVLPDD